MKKIVYSLFACSLLLSGCADEPDVYNYYTLQQPNQTSASSSSSSGSFVMPSGSGGASSSSSSSSSGVGGMDQSGGAGGSMNVGGAGGSGGADPIDPLYCESELESSIVEDSTLCKQIACINNVKTEVLKPVEVECWNVSGSHANEIGNCDQQGNCSTCTDGKDRKLVGDVYNKLSTTGQFIGIAYSCIVFSCLTEDSLAVEEIIDTPDEQTACNTVWGAIGTCDGAGYCCNNNTGECCLDANYDGKISAGECYNK